MPEGFQVLCQVCGRPNPPDAEFCGECNAPMEIRLKRQEELEQTEAAKRKLPPEIQKKVQDLEERIADGNEKPALYLQLSNLYKDYKIKDRAVQMLQKAIDLDPENNFLKQKMDLLTGDTRPIEARIEAIEAEELVVKKWVYAIYAALGLVAIVAAFLIFQKLLVPSNYRLSNFDGNTASVKYSPDGKRLAFLQIPRYSFMDLHPVLGKDLGTIDSKLLVAGLRGQEPEVITEFASYGFMWGQGLEFYWIPQSSSIAYVSWEDHRPTIKRVDLETKQVEKLAEGTDPTFSFDGRYLAYLAPSSDEKQDDSLFSEGLSDLYRFFYSRMGDDKMSLNLKNMITGESEVLIEGKISSPDFSPNSLEIVYEKEAEKIQEPTFYDPRSDVDIDDWLDTLEDDWSFSGNIFKFDLTTRTETALTKDDLSSEPTWTPDGRSIAYKNYEDLNTYKNVIMIMSSTGRQKRMLLGAATSYESFGKFSFSHDGKLMAFEAQFVNPDRPNLPTKSTPLGMMGGGDNIQSDIFVKSTEGGGLHRLEGVKHKFKHNPQFHPQDYRLAYEIVQINNVREAWITKIKP